MHRDRGLQGRLLCGTAAIALLLATGAHAEEAKFNIAAQPLADGLNEFAKQSGRPVMFTPEVADAKVTHGVVSNVLDPEKALTLVLADTGLTWRKSGDTYLIVSASDPQSGSAAGDGADQGTVQALIVTAQKREENIQDVPIAMSAFTQEDLTRSQVAGGPDLMTQVPNFTFTKTNFSGYSIQIRGIGTQAISATVDPAVAVAFNNTPFIRNRFFEQEFYDLERVEVLRGPQGTLYGRNATAGVVNIISAKPKNHFEAKLSADVANYSSSRLEGMINLPLVEDKAALRIAGAWTKRDGYVKNTITGRQTDGRDLWSTRVTLGLTPVDWFKAHLIWEHFRENDDRLRSGKQLCHRDNGPSEVGGIPIIDNADPVFGGPAARIYWTQGCKPASLYSPDSYETPNGFALPYGPAAAILSAPIDGTIDPYTSRLQSRNLREIETRFKPDYEATNDTVELQLQFDLPGHLTLASETGFNHDHIFSFEDFNRFNTRPGIFVSNPSVIVPPNGVLCDPQLGCSDRMAAGDLSTAKSRQFSQEFRLSSNYEGSLNFSFGANFLRYDTEDKYYVFFNTLSPIVRLNSENFGSLDHGPNCFFRGGNGLDFSGYAWSNPARYHGIAGINCSYEDTNDIHHLNDEGRNYFLSKNPYHLLSYAAFGEVYWQVTPGLKLTAGFRWTDDRKTAPSIPSWLLVGSSWGMPTLKVINQEWREPTGRLAVDWKPQLGFTDETLLYASYVHGYKAGGANPPGFVLTDVPACPPSCGGDYGQSILDHSLTHPATFKPEFVNAYEVGTKNTLLDGRLTFNLNAFYYDYTGYQISQIVDRSAVNLNFDARIWGSELEVDWRPLENLRLGFKGGYERTRMANGSRAIDLMDRTAGMPGWMVQKPFPTFPSNCVVPTWLATDNGQLHTICLAYISNTDPATNLPYVPNPTETAFGMDIQRYYGDNYPGYDPSSANFGEGFPKDLSGHELPNAPHFTATVTADYTLPLPNDWLVTLHTDLYYQSEAWTRVFNTPGYDKLKAYNNINFAAIFANEDAGWQVMAYVKNVLDRTNITGAFLNSDDTGLTTNVFLNEPRLYGIRVTKQWTGGSTLGGWLGERKAGEPYPMRVELDGDYGRFGQAHQRFAPPYSTLFNADFPHHDDAQSDLDWGGGGGVKFTYQPNLTPWSISASVRYGRALGEAVPNAKQALPDTCLHFYGHVRCQNPSTGATTLDGAFKYNATGGKYNFYDAASHNEEVHTNADFTVGRDFGLGGGSERLSSTINAGLSYAHLQSSADLTMHVRPDISLPSDVNFPLSFPLPSPHLHRLNADLSARRSFEGAGPSFAWDGTLGLLNVDQAGRVGVDVGLGGAILFGKQKARVREHELGAYTGGPGGNWSKYDLTPPYDTTLTHVRTKSVTVPTANARLGLSYELGRLKLSGGYRWERYFKAIDAGVAERKTYDRTFDGPYFKVSVGFGG